MMYLASALNTRDKSLIPNIVSFFTRSGIYHSELVFSDNQSFSVTPKYIGYLERHHNWYEWTLTPLPMISGEAEYKIRDEVNAILATKPKYDYLGALFGFFAHNLQDKNRWYCSELCRHVLKDYIPGLRKYKWLGPDDLLKEVSLYIEKNYPSLHHGYHWE